MWYPDLELNAKSENLEEIINRDNLEISSNTKGFGYTFVKYYPEFTNDEKELHAIIKGITVFLLHLTNEALLDWLKSDTYFKAQHHCGLEVLTAGPDQSSKIVSLRMLGEKRNILAEMAADLAALETHLVIWRAKYKATILPNRPDRALVYLNDEQKHGPEFPKAIDDHVAKAVKEF